MAWLMENFSTILIFCILLVIFGLIIHGMIKDKKAGKHICGGDCSHCGHCSAMNKKTS